MPRVDNPVIGAVDCPVCAAANEVKRNRGGQGVGYFFCTGCGYGGKFTKKQTLELFVSTTKHTEPDYAEQHEPAPGVPPGTVTDEAAEQNRSAATAELDRHANTGPVNGASVYDYALS